MPQWPTYVALTIDKLMCGIVEAAKHYSNDKAVRENVIASIDTSLYLAPVRAFYRTLDKFEDSREDKIAWDVVPECIPEVLRAKKKARTDSSSQPGGEHGGRPNNDHNKGRHISTGGGSGGTTRNATSYANATDNNQRRGYQGHSNGTRNDNGGHRGASERNDTRNEHGGHRGSSERGRRRSYEGGSFGNRQGADPKAKGCFIVNNPRFAALCVEARNKYCERFATVGRSCTRPDCRYIHTWFDRYDASEKEAQIAYIEANKENILFNRDSFGVRSSLPANKAHLLGSATPPSGENNSQS